MMGIYFSGIGNSKYALEVFLKELNNDSALFSIEDENIVEQLSNYDEIVFSYPVQYSAVPKILRDFIHTNSEMWQGKKIFIIATMALFSGDGAGVLGRLLKRYGAITIGGLHLQMPDSIADEKVLKRSYKKNTRLVEKATEKTVKTVALIKSGKYPQEGLGFISRILGFLTQRVWFGHRTQKYNHQLKINTDRCVDCFKCVQLCPTQNIVIKDNIVVGNDKCTMCYRCINQCPKQAITLLGKTVIEQTSVKKYLK